MISTLVISLMFLITSKIAFSNFYRLFDQQQTFFSYETTLISLQDRLNSYFNGTTYSEEDIRSLITQLEDTANVLPEYFPHAQFIDTRLLTDIYLRQVLELTRLLSTEAPLEALGAFEKVQQLYQELLLQYKTTAAFQKKISIQKAKSIQARWLIQVPVAFLFLLLTGSISLLDGRRMVKRIVLPLFSLTHQANRISAGETVTFQNTLPPDADTALEIRQLSDAFLSMSDTIHQQMEELKEKIVLAEKLHTLEMQNMQIKMRLSQAEMSQFQSLINPHFLFNCLSMLSGLALLEQAPKTYDYALNIAQFLRSSLKLVGKIVPLQDEVAHIRHYISIQQQRFGDRISFSVIYDTACDGAMLPAIVLQPLVENSLIHGVSSYSSGGTIQLKIERREGLISLSVSDNGVGLSPEYARAILEQFASCDPVFPKKTGLYGVIYSMKYYFQDKVQMQINRLDQGVCIVFIFPYESV